MIQSLRQLRQNGGQNRVQVLRNQQPNQNKEPDRRYLGLYVSPVGFSSHVVPAQWRLLYSINPMVGVIDGFRYAILGEHTLYWPGFCISLVAVVLIIVTGICYFRHTERTFADII